MGLMGRYESNVMTYVRPSNNKLVDRCVRYASQLLEEKEIVVSYEDLVTECFRLMKDSIEDRPVVKELVKNFSTH
jgi:N-acetylmuramic acid 6-phosphate etherase